MRTIGTITLNGETIVLRYASGAEAELPLSGDPADEATCQEVLAAVKRHWHRGASLRRGRQVGALTVFDVVEHPASIEAAVRELVEAMQ